jgi:hypothetical protein
MKEITYNNQKKEIPDSLEELSPKEYYRYLELVLMMNAGEISPFQMRCKLLSCLLGMKHSLLLCRGEIQEELLAQLPALDGFFDITSQEGMTVYDARLKTGRNLLPAYKEWKGPGDMLSGITFGQFIECMGVMAEMERAREQGNEEGIGELIFSIGRLLYKKQGPQETGTPPFPVCFHAYIFFLAVWELIYSVPISTNGKDIDFSILFEKSGRGNAGDNTDWVGISYDVAASGVFGDFRQVNDTPFWDVMLYIYKCRFEMLHNNKKQ